MEIRTEAGAQISAQPRQAPRAEAATPDAVMPETLQEAAEAALQVTPAQLPENLLIDAIKLLGFTATKENVAIATALIQNGIPVTEDNMRQLNRGIKLTGDSRQAVFLLQNGLTVNTKNADTLDGMVSGRFTLLRELALVAEMVDALPDGPVKETLTDLLTGGEVTRDGNPNAAAVMENATVPPAEEVQTTEIPVIKNQPAANFYETSQPTQTVNAETANIIPETDAVPPPVVSEPQTATDIVETSKVAVTDDSAPIGNKTTAPAAVDIALPNYDNDKSPIPATTQRPAVPTTDILPADPALPERLGQPRNHEKSSPSVRYVTSNQETVDTQPPAAPKEAVPVRTAQKPGLYAKMLARYAINPETSGKDDIDKHLNLLKEALSGAKRILAQNPNDPLYQKLERTARSLDFLNDTQKLVYLQIPVISHNREQNAGLYVFRDKGRKKEKSGHSQSALLALDMAYLGHFEAYIQRDNQSVACRFKVPEHTRELLAATIGQLQAKLKAKGFSLEACSFVKEGDPFTLLEPEPVNDNHSVQDDGLVFINIQV